MLGGEVFFLVFSIHSRNFVLPVFCLHIMEPSLNNKLKKFHEIKSELHMAEGIGKKILRPKR